MIRSLFIWNRYVSNVRRTRGRTSKHVRQDIPSNCAQTPRPTEITSIINNTLFKNTFFLLLLSLPILTATARADDQPTVLVVVGISGTEDYGADFAKSADHWADAAKKAPARLLQIGRDPIGPATTPANANLPMGPSDKQKLKTALDEQLRETTQPLWIVFIGHGTYDGHEAKFNLRGDDLSEQELAQWLKPAVRPLAVIDCTSASATFLNRLSAPNRIVVTATRSGREINYARFGAYLSEAIADPAADLDKDGQTSLLEAFIAAAHRTEEFYKSQDRLMTEHALIDDNGDALGTPADWFEGVRAIRSARNNAKPDGTLANQWALIKSSQEKSLSSAQTQQRDALEQKIEALRAQKNSLPEQDYYAQLDAILLRLAQIYYQPTNITSPELPHATTNPP